MYAMSRRPIHDIVQPSITYPYDTKITKPNRKQKQDLHEREKKNKHTDERVTRNDTATDSQPNDVHQRLLIILIEIRIPNDGIGIELLAIQR